MIRNTWYLTNEAWQGHKEKLKNNKTIFPKGAKGHINLKAPRDRDFFKSSARLGLEVQLLRGSSSKMMILPRIGDKEDTALRYIQHQREHLRKLQKNKGPNQLKFKINLNQTMLVILILPKTVNLKKEIVYH